MGCCNYRFHDAFHLAHAAVLGWSPVTRFLLSRKRKCDLRTGEGEDGGRAIAIEKGISALAFFPTLHATATSPTSSTLTTNCSPPSAI